MPRGVPRQRRARLAPPSVLSRSAALGERRPGGRGGIARSLDALADPRQAFATSVEGARTAGRVAADIAAMAMMADDSPDAPEAEASGMNLVAGANRSRSTTSMHRQVAGCSSNDVLLARLGAIGSWSLSRRHRRQESAPWSGQPAPLADSWKLATIRPRALVLPIGGSPIPRLVSRFAQDEG